MLYRLGQWWCPGRAGYSSQCSLRKDDTIMVNLSPPVTHEPLTEVVTLSLCPVLIAYGFLFGWTWKWSVSSPRMVVGFLWTLPGLLLPLY